MAVSVISRHCAAVMLSKFSSRLKLILHVPVIHTAEGNILFYGRGAQNTDNLSLLIILTSVRRGKQVNNTSRPVLHVNFKDSKALFMWRSDLGKVKNIIMIIIHVHSTFSMFRKLVNHHFMTSI
jgi:hypothetical protein